MLISMAHQVLLDEAHSEQGQVLEGALRVVDALDLGFHAGNLCLCAFCHGLNAG